MGHLYIKEAGDGKSGILRRLRKNGWVVKLEVNQKGVCGVLKGK